MSSVGRSRSEIIRRLEQLSRPAEPQKAGPKQLSPLQRKCLARLEAGLLRSYLDRLMPKRQQAMKLEREIRELLGSKHPLLATIMTEVEQLSSEALIETIEQVLTEHYDREEPRMLREEGKTPTIPDTLRDFFSQASIGGYDPGQILLGQLSGTSGYLENDLVLQRVKTTRPEQYAGIVAALRITLVILRATEVIPDTGLFGTNIQPLINSDGTEIIPFVEEHDYKLPNGFMVGNRYRIETPLAVGGLSEIYAAWDTRNDSPVVIKVPLPGLSQMAGIIAQAEVLMKLKADPGIVQVIGFGRLTSEEGHPGLEYSAMQKLEGVSLRTLLLEKPKGLPLPWVTDLTRDIASRLEIVHSKGLIWRDVAPDNIWLNDKGETILIDPLIPHKPQEYFNGKPKYVAPEQVDGNEVAASDMFSTGVVIYEALTGKHPFMKPKETADPWLDRLAQGDYGPLQPDAKIPDQLFPTMKRLLAFNPADRPTASELHTELAYPPK